MTPDTDARLLTHGYATTIYASQGQTADAVIGAVGHNLSGQLWNVLASRGRQSVQLFVPDKRTTIDRAPSKIVDRPLALDFKTKDRISAALDSAQRTSTQHRTQSFLRARLLSATGVALRFKTAVCQKTIAGPLRTMARAVCRAFGQKTHSGSVLGR